MGRDDEEIWKRLKEAAADGLSERNVEEERTLLDENSDVDEDAQEMKHCVLIVDDDPLILHILKHAFRNVDCEVISADDGQKALQLIVHSQPSLIISDWHMPVLDGLQLFLQIKNSPLTNHIPFVFLTTTDDAEVRIALLEIGVEDYWLKPFNAREVEVRVKRLLERLGPPAKARRPKSASRIAASSGDASRPEIINKRYQVMEAIGKGGMGVVYKVTDLKKGRQAALKLLRSEYVSNEEAVRRFACEATAAMKISHPNVVTTYEYGLMPNGQAYITMELLSGRSLSAELNEKGSLSVEESIELMRQICSALSEAHRQGVVHRDLKPDNIFLIGAESEKPLVKVLDFGLALLQNIPSASRVTTEGAVMGTPVYLSPEQAAGEPLDARSDIYALGVIFYELLAGSPPFDGTPSQVMYLHINKEPVHIKHLKRIDDRLADLIMQMLSKYPDERPGSAEEIIDALDRSL